jgi:magnesium-transporting ATPase (P-type)
VGSASPGNEQIKWNDIDGKPSKTTNGPEEVKSLSKEYLLCVTGPLLDKIFQMENVAHIIRCIHVFSRTSPNQKTAIVA